MSKTSRTKKTVKNTLRLITFLLGIVIAIISYRYNIGDYFTIENAKLQQQNLKAFYQLYPGQTILIYAGIYILITTISIPGATVLTLLGGALFNFWVGLIVVSFCSIIGASLAFIISRFIAKETIEQRFPTIINKINDGIKKQGAFYILTLRLVPIFPFFIVNMVTSVTQLKLSTFFWASQLGMLPGTAVYVNAGKQLASIQSAADILSAPIIVSFILIAAFPFVVKGGLSWFKNANLYRRYKKPATFDYNVVVIGAGSGGLVASYIAAAAKAKVALIEKDKMGGDCLNTGCVPSKALIKTASLVHNLEKAKKIGLLSVKPYTTHFSNAMKHVKASIKAIEPHDSVKRYSSLGVECFKGTAKIRSPWEIAIGNKIITTKNIIISTGAAPFVPPLKNIEKVNYLTSDTVWNLKTLPKRLVVLGGGPIGCELAMAFNRLGSAVTQVEVNSRIMRVEDPEVSDFLTQKFKNEGINILTGHRAIEFQVSGKTKYLIAQSTSGKKTKIPFDEILISIGRRPNAKGFGAEDLGIELRPNGTIAANEFMQTNYPNIYVCGDITGPFQFTHTAGHQAYYAAFNALYGKFKKFKVDYNVIPWCTYTDPEIASVGLNEQRAQSQGTEYDLTTYDLKGLDRAVTDLANEGFVRILTRKGSDKILGVTIVAANASTLILEFIAAMKNNFGLKSILATIHIYPSMGEANKAAAGIWRKKSISPFWLNVSKRLHDFARR
ncbi:hypothetical protein COTS27_00889 [Spirochaetota bacterium]|nr:hypothetical protein COTS27_00889 [Spirochaetota bacterium]